MDELKENTTAVWQERLIARGPTPTSYKRVDLTKPYPNEEAETRQAWKRESAKITVRKEALHFDNDRVLLRTGVSLEANPGNVLRRAVETKAKGAKRS